MGGRCRLLYFQKTFNGHIYRTQVVKKVKACIAVNASISPLRELACQWDHTVYTCPRKLLVEKVASPQLEPGTSRSRVESSTN